MGTIAPATFASGMLPYPRFPEWLGKNSTTKKIERMIRDVREMCAHHLYSDKKSILFESIPLIFHMVYANLAQGGHDSIAEAVSILEDFSLSLDAFKENIVGLQLDQRSLDAYNALPAPVKGNFTKIYNSVFKSSIKAAKGRSISSLATDHFSLHKNFDAGEEAWESSSSEEEEREEEVVGEQIGSSVKKGGAKAPAPKAPARGGIAAAKGGAKAGYTAAAQTSSVPPQ